MNETTFNRKLNFAQHPMADALLITGHHTAQLAPQQLEEFRKMTAEGANPLFAWARALEMHPVTDSAA